MSERPSARFRPCLENLEAKQLPSTVASLGAAARRVAAETKVQPEAVQPKPTHGYLVFRITNPSRYNNTVLPPFQQVLVQRDQPVRGQTYNILSVVVRNGTARTFTASDNLRVRLSQQNYSTPILTDDQQWRPGQWIVFYVLTKKYYPLPSQVKSGFNFNLGGARSLAIPGPSGIFQRITYNPATFPRTLDAITSFGVGAQGGAGYKYGLPVTNVAEFVSAKTNRNDFGGYF
ncbi:hypothetical protein OJF2_30370 [Aquisphaera giovannonii]|uniref:Uncharacterized protein n=1 Tax=Aquisphaera giovannonii TaxID=406548 RepID=A0A5B9W1U7_9BACT|nr:hypothetical protein [Aquisphaera giovannonii]QEH34498.1 hypothetical protein OJF2_30370 [Aquisphaera giovannonii]